MLAAEQESNAALRQELASAQAAVAASEAARSNTGSNLRAQLEAQVTNCCASGLSMRHYGLLPAMSLHSLS